MERILVEAMPGRRRGGGGSVHRAQGSGASDVPVSIGDWSRLLAVSGKRYLFNLEAAIGRLLVANSV